MDYWPAYGSYGVRFYTYDASGSLLTQAPLDTEGNKPTPGLCLSCHGGTLQSNNQVVGAKFLPFDLEAFDFKPSGAYSKAGQQEAFRRLNQTVKSTVAASDPIAKLIDGWYASSGGVNAFGATQNPDYVPSGWSTEPVLYQKAFAPYCRTCHVALNIPFETFAQLQSFPPEGAICETKYMPHAEITRNAFWASSARAHLAGALSWSNA